MNILNTELSEIIANGENSFVEFKRDDCRSEQLAREIVAMANHNGGVILLGVEDNGRVSGINRENLEEWVMDSVFASKVHPLIVPDYQEVRVNGETRIAVLTIERGVLKPYVRRHNGREEIFIRIGSTSRLATREQQARLFAVGGLLHTEKFPVSGSSIQSLDMARIEDYLANICRDPDIPTSEANWVRRLINLGFVTKGNGPSPVCTMAGVLLFGINPRRYLPQAGIRLMVFEGVEKDYGSRMDEVLDLPLVGLQKLNPFGERQPVADGVIENVIQMLKPFISQESVDIDNGMRRQRTWYYPIEAVREVIINALAHRDWTRNVDIEITSYSNRLEVISPGSMHNSMTVEDMIAGQRLHRNGIMVGILRDYGYVEARGMGVRTKVIPLMERTNGIAPQFELTDDYLKTILYRRNS